ncbi:MAG: hypothetical protein ACRDQ9_17230 [Pseudonocardiaceae bacterium]
MPRGGIAGPPARRAAPCVIVGGKRFGERHQVGQHTTDQVATGVAAQQVRAEPGQAAHQVELRQRRTCRGGHPGVGHVQVRVTSA